MGSRTSSQTRAPNPDSDLDFYQRVSSGPLGSHRDAVLATYTTVISGGNLRAQSFGVFIEKVGKTTLLPTRPIPTGQVDRVTVARGKVLAHWMSYKPSDPQCCPSLSHTAIYAIEGDAVVATR